MTKLIGTDPNQVPSNADLGSAAFMNREDFLTSRGSSLSANESLIDKSSYEVFIYDTTLDSDGGAWRKRTSHTSWYNEVLGTETRGNRREFPQIAIITVDGSNMHIHDGDDPSHPLWMKFERGTGLYFDATQPTEVKALNGNIFVCGGPGSILINFISDTNDFRGNSNRQYNYGRIVDRNKNNGWKVVTTDVKQRLLASSFYDCDMTIMPEAPIDPVTKLPIPRIVVGGQGGTSVIDEEGYTHDIGNFSPARGVAITPKHLALFSDSGGAGYLTVGPSNINWDHGGQDTWKYSSFFSTPESSTSDNPRPIHNSVADGVIDGDYVYAGGADGYNTFWLTDFTNSRVQDGADAFAAFITKDYNTGWMNGDIQLAALSDKNSSLMSSSGNANIASGKTWTNSSSFPYETLTTSGLDITSAINTTAYGAVGFTWTPTIGKTYTVYFSLTLNSGTAPKLFVESSSSWGNNRMYQTVSGTNSFTFTAEQGVSSFFNFSVDSGVATNFSISGLQLYEGGVADRSSNHRGLSVYGKIKRTPVASNADLVGYSNFSTTAGRNYTGNRLVQANNPNYDFTGDFNISFWTRGNTGDIEIWWADLNGDNGWMAYHNTNTAYFLDGNWDAYSSYEQVNSTSPLNGVWNKWNWVRRGDTLYSYLNGVYTGRYYDSLDGWTLTNTTNHELHVYASDVNTTLALLHISKTALTDEQIKKVYEEEKVMFEENAKCTLYGTSDAVTAVTVDPVTKELHIGTSSGRSVFQGLVRKEYSTHPISNSISAVNGMVAEE